MDYIELILHQDTSQSFKFKLGDMENKLKMKWYNMKITQ